MPWYLSISDYYRLKLFTVMKIKLYDVMMVFLLLKIKSVRCMRIQVFKYFRFVQGVIKYYDNTVWFHINDSSICSGRHETLCIVLETNCSDIVTHFSCKNNLKFL